MHVQATTDRESEPGIAHSQIPAVVDRTRFQAELDALRVREKAHTRAGDAIAAARRRLPMVEVDAKLGLIGPQGPVSLFDVFEGRRQLIAYYFMWETGRPAAGIRRSHRSMRSSPGAGSACSIWCATCGRDTGCLRLTGPTVVASRRWTTNSQSLLDLTAYGRQEAWENSPAGWPRRREITGERQSYRTDGRPIAQWSRIQAGRSD